MTLNVNGDAKDVPDGTTVRQLVTLLNLKPERVAVERNRRLVRGDGYDAPLAAGDEVEIVTFVGGG
jgi:thiamine biosynthesis protein ThiS